MTTTSQPTITGQATNAFDVERIRRDFPILSREVHGKPLVYLDNAATTQKPQCVIDALTTYYSEYNANIHRGVHALSVAATEAYEGARLKIQRFINAGRPEEIVYVRSATEAINLVAQTWGVENIAAGDEIIITGMEHHSNIVPWQMLCAKQGARLRVVPLNDNGELELDEYERMLSPKVKLVAAAHVSNALGTVNPVERLVELAHAQGAVVLLDGAQAVPHAAVDVQAIGCDFYALSSHKVFGPTGVGALYAKYDLLTKMPPYQGGGDMIASVTFENTIYNDVPHKFEAGTPNIADAIGFGAAIDYVTAVGMDAIAAHERDLLEYATEVLSSIPEVRFIGTAKARAAVVSFVIEGVHPHDAGTILDLQGVAVRAGHHCAQPVMLRFKVPATVRASMAFYNTRSEIDALATAVRCVVEKFN